MSQQSAAKILRPATDDRVICDVVEAALGYQAVFVAHDIKLFSTLAEGPMTLSEISQALGIAHRPARAILAVCVSLGLISFKDDRYCLARVSEDYLLERNPTYAGAMLDFAIDQSRAFYTFDNLKKAVMTNRPQVYDGTSWVEIHRKQSEVARNFTSLMHGHSLSAALVWPETVDLAECKTFLDIGGGSGAHSIGTALAWPNLQAIIFDIAPVCEVAEGYIASYELQDRVRAQVGDIWNDIFPPSDIHFYSDIYHDWPPERCHALTEKSFASLEPGGRIIIHEMLYNDDEVGPFTVAACAVEMLLWNEGQQYSGGELSAMLAEAGFIDIEVKPTFGYWSIVTGRKPRNAIDYSNAN